jgi:hypothetical protein
MTRAQHELAFALGLHGLCLGTEAVPTEPLAVAPRRAHLEQRHNI